MSVPVQNLFRYTGDEGSFLTMDPSRRRRSGDDVINFCAVECRYDCVIRAARDRGWRIVEEEEGAHVFWVDVSGVLDRLGKLKRWQRMNHFPGMSNVARKNRLAQNLEKMRKAFPKDFNFSPRTWVLPLELSDFRSQFDQRGKSSRFFIIKPEAGCKGRGIFLTQDLDDILTLDQVVAQDYIRRPYLIDGYKFDLRLYVLITSCKPLRMYLFNDGLVRLCTEEYTAPSSKNANLRCMHLTNYSINKHSDKFVQPGGDSDASKRSLKWFMREIAEKQGLDKAEGLWRRMGALCVKTIISILPTLVREYENNFQPSDNIEGSRCFEILGFDVIIDALLKPWLIEVNHLPSFATESSLDENIKSKVVRQTLAVIQVKSTDRTAYETTERLKQGARLYQHRSNNSSRDLEEETSDQPASDDESDVTDDEVEREEGVLSDFDRIYPVPRRKGRHRGMPSYAKAIAFACHQDELRYKRMSYPLRQQRNTELTPDDGQPPVIDELPWGQDPFRRSSKITPLPERKPLPMPGTRQLRAADRLTKGFSAAKVVLSDDLIANRMTAVVNKAKEWRLKCQSTHRRTHTAIQPKTFVFFTE